MKEIVIISGKGGTGKTSVAAALAALAKPVTLVDCDVDAADLHLVTQPRLTHQEVFIGGKKAQINSDQCEACGACLAHCRFNAIRINPDPDETAFIIDAHKCEGCGACVPRCPHDAIQMEPVENGHWFISETLFGPMVHARLGPGEDNSGKLISLLRKEAKRIATREGHQIILCDGSPGIGCPVIASLTGASLAIVVAEPSLSGHHDALRVMKVAKQLHVPLIVAVNRWEMNPEIATAIETDASQLGVTQFQRICEDRSFLTAQLQQRTVIDLPNASASKDLRALWKLCVMSTHSNAPSSRF
jgi:MinD superfamily P-loop ATPase